jgi:hypothetical protein
VAWQDNRSGMAHIYAQKLGAETGASQWTANGVLVCTAEGYETYPQLVTDGAGGAIIAWEDVRPGGDGSIYAQRVASADGAPIWALAGVGVCTATGLQDVPELVSDGASGAIITWEDHRGTENDIYAQKVEASDGAPLWTADGMPVCAATKDQDLPAIASDTMGGAVIAWWDYRSGTKWNIYAQRLGTAAGAPQWTADGVAVTTATISRANLDIASDASGGAIIAWEDSHAGQGVDIYMQKMAAATGAPQWQANGVGVCTASENQELPRVAPDGAGGVIAVWEDHRNGNNDIYAQRVLGATGASQWTADGVPVCTAAHDQQNPVLAGNGKGGAVIGWGDLRGQADYDVYASYISSQGTLGTAGVSDWELF